MGECEVCVAPRHAIVAWSFIDVIRGVTYKVKATPLTLYNCHFVCDVFCTHYPLSQSLQLLDCQTYFLSMGIYSSTLSTVVYLLD